tara:strand:+ start:878 stop:1198 length:321 start_codon:yes stop_codon:yes gene_type:complete
MKQTVTEQTFVDAFVNMNREDNFTRPGRIALYEYLTELEEEWGIELELDVIAICCEYTEYADEDEVRKAYGLDEDEDIDLYTIVIEAGGYNWNGRTEDSTIIIRDW